MSHFRSVCRAMVGTGLDIGYWVSYWVLGDIGRPTQVLGFKPKYWVHKFARFTGRIDT